ncbi:GNAT family N-acetyltransferase [Vibrio parahaemolyticus]|uniref:GNAT family N-acetyltransferase n=1 Tax=Vibrio parahaemolyticus TaxID=670 RepID=UPI003B675AEF
MDIRLSEVAEQDLSEIMALAMSVNEKHVIPLLSNEGQASIRTALKSDVEKLRDKAIYTAVKASSENQLLGYIAWRDGNYLGQLYVDSNYHGQGIARKLVEEMKLRCSENKILVKASIYALGFYQKVGFVPLADELSIKGMRYVPMALSL